MTSRNDPPRRSSHGGRKAADSVARQMLLWAADRSIPEGLLAVPLVIALYMMERATGSWISPTPGAKQRLKYGALRAIPSGIIDYLRSHDTDVAAVERSDALKNLRRNLYRRLSLEQVAEVRAQPVVGDRMLRLLNLLENMAATGQVHELWALRWKALLLTGRAAGLRISELIRCRESWLEWTRDKAGGEVVLIHIPWRKYRDAPSAIPIWPSSDSDACAYRIVRLWTETLHSAGLRLESDPLFPDVRPHSSRARPPSVSGKVLADFPSLVEELVEDDCDPATIAAGSGRSMTWRCRACGHEWATRVQTRTLGGSACPKCSNMRRRGFPDASTAIVSIDPLAEKLDIVTCSPEEEEQIQRGAAVKAAVASERRTFDYLCERAGLEARDMWERIAPNGLRRGCAVELIQSGANRREAAEHLGHTKPDTSLPYLEELDLPYPNVVVDLPGWRTPPLE